MPEVHHFSVEIEAHFGSKFQQNFAVRMLEGLLYAWRDYVVAKHKNNCLTYRVIEVESAAATKAD